MSEKYIILHIEDNGMGIDLDLHGQKLFGMYKTFHTNKDARGLGLFITKNQVDAMGGKIEVESEVDKGSTFKVFIKN
jgi:signal transduction histidine kinase